MVNEIAQYQVFSTIDLQGVYHEVPLKGEDIPYTAFKAQNNLYQFTCVPFGITNGVACFKREMLKFVEENDPVHYVAFEGTILIFPIVVQDSCELASLM